MQQTHVLLRKLFLLLLMSTAFNISYAQDIYWVGRTGDWDDVNNWYKDAAGVNAAGIIPGFNIQYS